METNEQKKCGPLSACQRLIAFVAAAFVVGIAFGLLVSSLTASSPSPMQMVRDLESAISRTAPGDDGEVLATIEGEKITRKMFDLQLGLFLQSAQRYPQEEVVRMKNNPTFLRQFLKQLVENRVILKAMEDEKEFKGNAEMLVFMNLSLADGLQKYYLYKKAGSISVETNVSDDEIEKTYDQLRRDPRYADKIDRVPFDQLKSQLAQEIVKQRQMGEVRGLLEKVRSRYRINIQDEKFGKMPPQTNAAAGTRQGQP